VRLGSAAEVRHAAAVGWLPPALGVIGTLLLHLGFVCSLIFGLGPRGAAVSPYDASNADFGPLLLISFADATDSGSERTRENHSRKFVPRKLAASVHTQRLPARDTEKDQTTGSQISAKVVDGPSFIKMCRENYPDAAHFNRDLATLSLQGANIEVSGGDRQRALMALQCLQAFGTFGAMVVGQSGR
jgi:hypothetical protein